MEESASFGRDHGLLHELVVTGRKVGADRVFYARLAHNEKLFGKVVSFVRDYSSTTQERAREIMSKNFFGVEEAVKHFGVNPTRQQLAVLSEIPFSEAVLEESKYTHVLVAVFPLSILEIRDKVKHIELPSGQPLLSAQSWYDEESFAKERGEVTWQLVRKTPVDDSTSKNWQEQQALIAKNDEVPSARVMVYTIVGHYLATGEHLFEHIYVRTSSVGSDGRCVDVGGFGSDGLFVDDDWVGAPGGGLGVSSARKPA